MNHNGAGFGGLGLELEARRRIGARRESARFQNCRRSSISRGVRRRRAAARAFAHPRRAAGEIDGRRRAHPRRLRAARRAGESRAHPLEQHRRARAEHRRPGKRRPKRTSSTCATEKRFRCAPRACVLACHHAVIPYCVPGAAGRAEGSAAPGGQGDADDHERRDSQLEGVRKDGRVERAVSGGEVSRLFERGADRAGLDGRLQAAADARRADRRRVERRHGRHGAEIGHERARHVPRRARHHVSRRRSRPTSATSGRTWRASSETAGSIRRATSRRSRSIAGRTATRPA